MGAADVLSRKTGVIYGDDVLRLFEYAREKQFAIPAIVSAFTTAIRSNENSTPGFSMHRRSNQLRRY